MLREVNVGLVVALPFLIGATSVETDRAPAPAFRFSDPAIVESSGLAVVDGLVVTVNDSGDEARAFVVDPATGETVGVTRWQEEAIDVEAVAPAGSGEVWVGDIGDNTASRDTVTVTRIPVGRGERDVPGETYRLRYPDGPADAEALLVHPETGRLVVVTKGVFGAQVLTVPGSLDPDGVTRLRPVGRAMPIVTDGAFLPDGRHLVLRDYGRALVYSYPALEPVGEVALPGQRQGEGLAVTDEQRLLVSTEGARSAVHAVPLPQDVVAALETDEPTRLSREGSELPAEDPGPRDPRGWLIGGGVAVVALLVLIRSLRPR